MQRVDDRLALPKLTLRGLVLGALITVLFTAANVYLGLKVGLTFSSSIPAAVISMAVLRLFPGANILENNMVQTQASAAGTLSAVIFIVPGLVMVGHWHGFPFWEKAGVCAAGGILGVVYTVPLRRAMVVQSDLTYPEGVAAAEVLRVGSGERAEAAPGERAEPGLRDILLGGGIAAAFSFLSGGLKVLADAINGWFALGGAVFRVGTGFSLALLGAGYLEQAARKSGCLHPHEGSEVSMAGSYSTDLRERVLAAVEAGAAPEAAARRSAVGRSTAYRWAREARTEGRRAARRMGGGPKPRIAGEVEAALLGLLAGANHLTLAECRDRLAARTGVRVHPWTLGRALRRCGWT